MTSIAAGRHGASEEALLRAAQMAVGGSDRAEIERALTTQFGIASPSPIVDEVFGTEARPPHPH